METGVTMAQLLENIGSFFTQSIDWLGDVLETVASNPVLLVMVIAMPCIGFSVGLLKRLVRL